MFVPVLSETTTSSFHDTHNSSEERKCWRLVSDGQCLLLPQAARTQGFGSEIPDGIKPGAVTDGADSDRVVFDARCHSLVRMTSGTTTLLVKPRRTTKIGGAQSSWKLAEFDEGTLPPWARTRYPGIPSTTRDGNPEISIANANEDSASRTTTMNHRIRARVVSGRERTLSCPTCSEARSWCGH